MNAIEAIVVANRQIGVVFYQHVDYIVAFLRDRVVHRRVAVRVAQVRMSAAPKQRLHHLQMALVDADVQGTLTPLIACVQITVTASEQLDNIAFVTERRMMNCSVTVFVLIKIVF